MTKLAAKTKWTLTRSKGLYPIKSLTAIVSEAVSSQKESCNRRTSTIDDQPGPYKKKAKKTPVVPLPSGFLRKSSKKNEKKKPAKKWTKDIICLPATFNDVDIGNPRGASRVQLARLGLIGKLTLLSTMDKEETRQEICTLFRRAFGGE